MNDLNSALETCLRSLDEGKSSEEALERVPGGLRAQLEPMLRMAAVARSAARLDTPAEAWRRGRAVFLQRAAEMRESRVPRRRSMIPMMPRAAMTMGLVAALVLTSTGLVSAASGALPGDQLYPVKRSWEGVRLILVRGPQDHYVLEGQFEQERLDEIEELLTRGRTAPITFSGLVMKRQNGDWLVSGIPVSIVSSTRLPALTVNEGVPVVITGVTRSDGVVEAQSVRLLQPGAALPPLEPSQEDDDDEGEEGSAVGIVPLTSGSHSPLPPEDHDTYEFTGIVDSMGASVWRINGSPVFVEGATIVGVVRVGTEVRFEGYYDPAGRFVVTSMEVETEVLQRSDGSEDESASESDGSESEDGSDDDKSESESETDGESGGD